MGLAAIIFGPGQSSSSPDGWISAVNPPSHAGPAVSEHGALQLTSVYAGVGVIADAVAQLPIDVYQKQGDQRIERPEHPVSVLLSEPNPYVGAFTLRNTIQGHTLLWGNGYLEVQRTNEGRPVALWPMLPDRTAIDRVEIDGAPRYRYRTSLPDGTQAMLDPADVIHIPALGFDGLRGYSPIWLARQAVGLGLALEQFGAKFFANDAKSGGFLSHPGKLGPEAHARLREQMNAQGGLSNAHRMKILEEGMTYTATTIPPEDAQFLMTRTFQVEEIARLFRIPLHMLQSQSKTTSWGTGIGQMSLGFLIYTLAPWLVRWEQELARKLFTEVERRSGFYVKHNVAALLRGDPATRSQYFERALKKETGWMEKNEVRALEDLNPLEEDEAAATPPVAPAANPEQIPAEPAE